MAEGILKSTIEVQTKRPDSVLLGTLLQATRGMMLIVFNWVIIFHFDHRPHLPIDVMIIAFPPVFYLMGFMDIIMLGWMKKERKILWFYGISMSIVILLVAPVMFQSLAFWPYAGHVSSKLLFAIIDVFAGAEIISLAIPSARRYYRL
ncbi:MAG: hypothetical protein EAX87_07070 [Candidatus Thorarchaeota archaeon]|nr:hypothetical protein [Candidatus Thorarchaeota archaeon]